MFCYKCGAEISDESVYCYKCGAKIKMTDRKDSSYINRTIVSKIEEMPPMQKPKTHEEVLSDIVIRSALSSIEFYCKERRDTRVAQGYFISCVDHDSGGTESVKCYSRLYRYNYPYHKNLERQIYFRDTREIVLQLGDDSYDGSGFGPRKCISKDKLFCDLIIPRLEYQLIMKGGFKTVKLTSVPVYAAEVRRSCYSHLFKETEYYEEGKLTNQCEGYVIQFDIRW